MPTFFQLYLSAVRSPQPVKHDEENNLLQEARKNGQHKSQSLLEQVYLPCTEQCLKSKWLWETQLAFICGDKGICDQEPWYVHFARSPSQNWGWPRLHVQVPFPYWFILMWIISVRLKLAPRSEIIQPKIQNYLLKPKFCWKTSKFFQF